MQRWETRVQTTRYVPGIPEGYLRLFFVSFVLEIVESGRARDFASVVYILGGSLTED